LGIKILKKTMVQEYNFKISNLEGSIKRYKIFAFSIMTLGGIFVLFFWYILFNSRGTEYDYLKDLGSISGGIVSSLFSLSGLILVYVAFLGQKQQLLNQQIEISHTKEELQLNRKELQNQRKEMQQQNETLKLQNFENTYFNLIDNYQKNVSINYVTEKRNLFKNFLLHYDSNFNFLQIQNKVDAETKSINALKNEYPVIADFSYVYQISSIISIINSSDLKNKQYYLKTLWGLLTQNEKKCICIIVKYYEFLEPEVKEIFLKSDISEYFT
jgi:hypothetical protein